MNKTLPQLCAACRNRSIKGRLRMPDQGVFKPVPDRYNEWRWYCNDCASAHHRGCDREPSWLE